MQPSARVPPASQGFNARPTYVSNLYTSGKVSNGRMIQGAISPCSKGSKFEHTAFLKSKQDIIEGHDRGKNYISRLDTQKLNSVI